MQTDHLYPVLDHQGQRRTKLSWRRLIALLVLVGLLLAPATSAQAEETGVTTDEPDVMAAEADQSWLEPRGISVVDLVGLVPEEHLRDTIVSWHVGGGLLQYVSGQRNGNTVTINVKISPRYWVSGDGKDIATIFSCLGKPSLADEWPSAIGAAKMRVYENGAEITSQIIDWNVDYVPAGQTLPSNNGKSWWRYEFMWTQKATFAPDGSVQVPANMGCKYRLPRKRTNLTATFVVESPNYITVETLGSQDFAFHSYIGVGNAGHFARLNSQMSGRFGNRHDKFAVAPPSGAEYVLVKYPPTPVEPYVGIGESEQTISNNIEQPSSGSYRFVGSGNTLSVDHTHSMALPLYGQWQDADQSGGSYLKFFNNAGRVSVPEYFVPAGIAYHPCMRNGGCSGDLLDRIYNATMTMSVYYYRIGRIADGLNRLPLRQVGPSWKPGAVAATVDAAAQVVDQGNVTTSADERKRNSQIFLPIAASAPPPPAIRDDGDRNGCPCGWFDGLGRMLDYVPGP